MEKSHKHTFAIITLILCILIIGGAYIYYRLNIRDKSIPRESSTNPFGNSGTTTVNYRYDPNIDRTYNYDGEVAPTPEQIKSEEARVNQNSIINTQVFNRATFSEPFIKNSIQLAPAYQARVQASANVPANQTVTGNPYVGIFDSYNPNYDYSTSSDSFARRSRTGSATTKSSKDDSFKMWETERNLFRYSAIGQLAYLVGGDGAVDMAFKAFNPAAGGGGFGGGGDFGGGGGGGGGGGNDSGGGSGGYQNFGGSISQVTYCTCSSSILLDINDVRNKQVSVLYTPGTSRLYSNYNIYSSNINVIGDYTQGSSECLVYHGEDCDSEGSPQGTIHQIGTAQSASQ